MIFEKLTACYIVILRMKKGLLKKVLETRQEAERKLGKFSTQERSQIEKAWDLEHTYYSSALEGSKLDRGEVERIIEAS